MPAFILTALKHWKIAGLVLLAALLAVQTFRLGHRTNERDAARINLNECREGRKQDRAAYSQAQRDAAAKNQAEVQRIESEQQRITSNVEADLRARLERLRGELRAKAPQSSANRAGASAVPQAPGDPDGAARLCLEAPELLRAAENEERHDQLIRWVEQQLKIER